MPSPYLSKGYFQLFRKFVEAAKKRCMMDNGRKIQVLDAQTGDVRAFPRARANNSLKIDLDLQLHEAQILVVRQ